MYLLIHMRECLSVLPRDVYKSVYVFTSEHLYISVYFPTLSLSILHFDSFEQLTCIRCFFVYFPFDSVHPIVNMASRVLFC